jgi:hypothetical protein
MGKGGSANVVERSDLAHTLPSPYDGITKKTLREAIPAHCFKRSYLHSLGTLSWDLAVVAFSIWAVHWANVGLPSVLVPFAYVQPRIGPTRSPPPLSRAACSSASASAAVRLPGLRRDGSQA